VIDRPFVSVPCVGSRRRVRTSPAALSGLAVAICLALSAAPQRAHAQEPPAQIDIQQQSLSDALLQLGQQTSLQFIYTSDLLRGIPARTVSGTMTPEQALRRLLTGTGVEYSRTGNVIHLRRTATTAQGATQLAPITVTGQASAVTEGSGAYTTGTMSTAAGLSLSPRQTPQSVSVVTRQQMDDFNLSTLQDVAKVTPGIYTKSPAITDQESTFYSRGFALSHVNVDGLPLDVTGFNSRNVSADMIMYDRVEVVRGATGLMDGVGSPSGSINLIRKRPTAEPLLNTTLSLGRWDNRQVTLDASRALNASGSVRGRVAAGWRDSDSFVDVTNTTNGLIYGVVEADLTPDTTLGVGAYKQRTRTDGVFTGLPTYADGRHMNLPRSTFLDRADTFQNRDNDAVFADLDKLLDNGWQLKFAVTQIEADSNTRNVQNSRIAGDATHFRQTETGWRYGSRQTVADARARGPVQWFGREHEVLFGASFRDDDSTAAEAWGGGIPRIIDIAKWNPKAYGMTGSVPVDGDRWGRKTREKALYASGNFSLADPLHLIVGGRLGWYTQDITGWYTGAPNWTRSLDESAKFIPYVGVVYDLDAHHSVYTSVTQTFQPQSAVDASGKTLNPLTGTNYEVGVKGEYFDGRLNTSAALYRVVQRNRAVRDDANCPTSGSVSCFRAAGEVESQGVDLQVAGMLAPGWQLSAGYTYVTAKYTKDANAANVGKRLSTDEPRHLFKLYSSYRLPGDYARWSVNGWLNAQAKTYRHESGFRTGQGSFAIVGVGTAYQFNEHINLQVNVDNLFDRTYYQELGYSWSGGLARYGAPRNVMMTLSYRL